VKKAALRACDLLVVSSIIAVVVLVVMINVNAFQFICCVYIPCVCVCVCMYVCMHVCMYVCMYATGSVAWFGIYRLMSVI
jgi:hypothetical protein